MPGLSRPTAPSALSSDVRVNTVVVAVHYQNDVLHPDGKIQAGLRADEHGRATLIRNARRLLAGARAQSAPVVSARIAFRPGYRGHMANSPMLSAVVAGVVATHSAVERTARHAADMGYEVLVAADACASGDPELHIASLRTLALHVPRVATVDEILGELEGARG